MWKPSQSASVVPSPVRAPEPIHSVPAPRNGEMIARTNPVQSPAAVIGKGLTVRGEITGTESLLIEGRVEGSVNIPGERVTIGQNGRVTASMTASMNVCISAREIVIMGNVTGNVSADRVEIRVEGTLNGDISTSRVSIADGALFRVSIDIHESNEKTTHGVHRMVESQSPPEPVTA